MVHLSSPYPVAETIAWLESLLQAQGLTDLAGRRRSSQVSYNSPEYLRQRHNISRRPAEDIAGVGPLLQKVVGYMPTIFFIPQEKVNGRIEVC
jgi:hypothetical protein